MSRNLEVLEQVQQDRELFRVAPVASIGPVHGKRANVSGPDFGTDAVGREQLLALAQRLFLATDSKPDTGPRQVVFCGIDEAEGTSVLCAQLGRLLASQVASRVCIVDANVRAPSLRRLLDVERSDGQSSQQASPQSQLVQQIASNLWLISGQLAATSGGVTASLDQIRSQIKELPPEFAHVVINAPPVGLYSDAAILGQWADGVVLVLEANSTRRVAARNAKQAVEGANVRVLGTVLNNRTFPIPEKIYRML
jgi:MinD-like ATPase involved in chromosome partitioning or flagellar assembly